MEKELQDELRQSVKAINKAIEDCKGDFNTLKDIYKPFCYDTDFMDFNLNSFTFTIDFKGDKSCLSDYVEVFDNDKGEFLGRFSIQENLI